jgi:hypothetical protein
MVFTPIHGCIRAKSEDYPLFKGLILVTNDPSFQLFMNDGWSRDAGQQKTTWFWSICNRAANDVIIISSWPNSGLDSREDGIGRVLVKSAQSDASLFVTSCHRPTTVFLLFAQ